MSTFPHECRMPIIRQEGIIRRRQVVAHDRVARCSSGAGTGAAGAAAATTRRRVRARHERKTGIPLVHLLVRRACGDNQDWQLSKLHFLLNGRAEGHGACGGRIRMVSKQGSKMLTPCVVVLDNQYVTRFGRCAHLLGLWRIFSSCAVALNCSISLFFKA